MALKSGMTQTIKEFAAIRLSVLLAKDSSINREGASYDIQNAVLASTVTVKEAEELLPQYGLLGNFSSNNIKASKDLVDNIVLLNTNIPFSAFICGVQGSGKSYTTSCLLGETAFNCILTIFG